jgi:glycosyltransferase involved in cell wall biosynthesis
MRIAIVINTSWNIYNFRKGLIKYFISHGHQIFAIAPPDDFSEKLVQELGCEYIAVNMDNKGSNPWYDIVFLKELYRIYAQIKPDVVLHYTIKPNIYGSIAAFCLGVPVINNVSGLGTVFLRKNLTSFIALSLYRLAFLAPKKVFFQNPHDQQLFVQKRLVSYRITDVLPGSGIDLNHFKPIAFERNKVFTFLLIARLLYDKGIVEYIEAIRILRKKGIVARFQLLGFFDESPLGISKRALESWIQEGLVEYLGRTDDVRPSIHAADCVVLPSYREGTPRTLLEAAALAKPIVTTNVPGCTEVVQDTINGLLCEVKNAEDLAAKMQLMTEKSDEHLQEMGRQSRLQVEKRFDEKEVIKKYEEVLVSLFGKSKVMKTEKVQTIAV